MDFLRAVGRKRVVENHSLGKASFGRQGDTEGKRPRFPVGASIPIVLRPQDASLSEWFSTTRSAAYSGSTHMEADFLGKQALPVFAQAPDPFVHARTERALVLTRLSAGHSDRP